MPRKTYPLPKKREYEPVVASAIAAASRAEAIAANIGGDLYTCRLRLDTIGFRPPLSSKSQDEIDTEWATLAVESLSALSAKCDRLRTAIEVAQSEVAKARDAKAGPGVTAAKEQDQ